MTKEILINEKLSEIIRHSASTLKNYTDSFPEQIFSKGDAETLKRISASYYICAGEITKDFDAVCALSCEVSALIENARAKASEDRLCEALAIFDKVLDISRDYESFLKSSEAAISDKNQIGSYTALRRAAVSLYTRLSSKLS